jgi:hypothetical protein
MGSGPGWNLEAVVHLWKEKGVFGVQLPFILDPLLLERESVVVEQIRDQSRHDLDQSIVQSDAFLNRGLLG